MNIARVTRAIDQAIANYTAEREGLGRRLADVTSRAAIVAGSDSNDYEERERAVSDRLSVLDSEVKNAQRRLDQLACNITQFEHLRAELKSCFSDHPGSETGRREASGYGAAAG